MENRSSVGMRTSWKNLWNIRLRSDRSGPVKIISGFGMRVIYHNRKKLSPGTETELDINYVGYQELISDSDILVITASLNDQNRHSFELETFKQMKRDSILVNIGRGGVIKESDLVLALKEDLIGGVGLDVFENPAKYQRH